MRISDWSSDVCSSDLTCLAKLDPIIVRVYERHCPQNRAAARPPVLWGKGGGLISPAPRQDAQPLSDQVHRVAGFAIALVAVLADPSGDVNQVAPAQISGALCQLADERPTVPVRIGLPFIANLAVRSETRRVGNWSGSTWKSRG